VVALDRASNASLGNNLLPLAPRTGTTGTMF
jgi:hypothetical protein